ncbi:hypothetical protein D9615_004522 [Tricholomella constricta]|uniref:Uncharacterized protein n=1 Tax=Tricholomella constricta TaxID=117010 RepID=A0A8H5M4B7_9AGAR|nr:hypothetical protein D9615_004522 [Tricholomella constricta]
MKDYSVNSYHAQALPGFPSTTEYQDTGIFPQTLKSHRSRFSRCSSGTSNLLLPSIQSQHLASKDPETPSNPFSIATPTLDVSTLPILADVSSAPTSTAALKPLLPCHILSLTYGGEDFTYDLETLESNPQHIIELLKATLSERGSWMTVGAHYRRSENARAAISVMENMITVMSEQGFSEDGLKPAYLLLSGCETDLGRRAKAEKSTDAEEHYRKAQMWLQKVYGTFEAESSLMGEIGVTSSTPRPSHAQYEPHSGRYPATLLIPKYTPMPPGESPREIRLEREIESLLKERKENAVILAEIRAAKRKLEDDLAYECAGRRRLLRDYDDLQNDLAIARKMENYAVSQVKREVEARRKAEENARAEKGVRLEIQRLFEQGAAPRFAEMVNTIKTEDGFAKAFSAY